MRAESAFILHIPLQSQFYFFIFHIARYAPWAQNKTRLKLCILRF